MALLFFFGLKSIKDAWELPSNDVESGEKSSQELDEFAEAEELVKEKVNKWPNATLNAVLFSENSALPNVFNILSPYLHHLHR